MASADFTPILIVAIAGRKRIFGLVSRRFAKDPDRLKRDGAFMAFMLDATTAQLGDPWWVHHGNDDEAFPTHDPRRNWHGGRVVHVDHMGFDVQLSSDMNPSSSAGHR